MPLPTPPATPTAALIRSWRKSAAMPQTALAARLQVSQARLSAWETGKNNIPVTLLAEIARICQISPVTVGEQLLSITGPA